MDPVLRWSRNNQSALIEVICEFVKCESPSDSPVDVKWFMDLIAESVSGIATARLTEDCALICKFKLPGRHKKGRLLALGHADTVCRVSAP